MANIPRAGWPLRRASDTRLTRAPEPRAPAGSRVFLVLGLCAALLTTAQLAGRRYIDPGSGSFAIQIIIAAVLGGILTARLWLRHIYFRLFECRPQSESDDQPRAEEAHPRRPMSAEPFCGPIAQRSEQPAHNR